MASCAAILQESDSRRNEESREVVPRLNVPQNTRNGAFDGEGAGERKTAGEAGWHDDTANPGRAGGGEAARGVFDGKAMLGPGA